MATDLILHLVLGISAMLVFAHVSTTRRWAQGWNQANQKKKATTKPSKDSWPFTVLIPARNEALTISKLLNDLAAQQSSFGMPSVLVVDDHSVDDTVEVVNERIRSQGMDVTLLSANETGKKAALMEGMSLVATPWVVTLDADVRLQPTWAQAWAEQLWTVDDNIAAVAGPVVLHEIGDSDSRWSMVQALDFACQLGWSAGQLVSHKSGSASGANFAVRPAVYPDTRSLGPSGDDTLVVQALQQGGHDVVWMANQAARVWTPGAPEMQSWVHQRLRWSGKAKHYPWESQKTAWWMAAMSVLQIALAVQLMCLGTQQNWIGALATMSLLVVMFVANVTYASPVAAWFGLRPTWVDWLLLGITQPLQVPLLLAARMGALQPWGISSQPIWKGRTCAS